MIDKFAKREYCLYCEKPMEAKNRNKKFCSAKCRVYFGRENGRDIPEIVAPSKTLTILIKKTEVKKAEKKQAENDVENDVKKTTKNEAPDPKDRLALVRWRKDNN